MTGIDFSLAVATVGIFGYWYIRERAAEVDRSRAQHPRSIQLLVRIFFPAIGGMVVAQLLGWDFLPMALPPVGERVTLFIGLAAYVVGFGLSIWSREAIGAHWAHAADYQVRPKQALVTDGPYRFIRHPIYTAFLLMFVGAELVAASWAALFIIPLGLYVAWQAQKEERLLLSAFGDAYRRYQQRSGKLLPRW